MGRITMHHDIMEQESFHNTYRQDSECDIFNQRLPIEQKLFFFDLRTTAHGKYLKITERRNNHCNTIKIPAKGLSDFREKLQEVIEYIGVIEQQS